MTLLTHAPQSRISSPTVSPLPPKPCPQPWYLSQTPSSTLSLPALWSQPSPPSLLLWNSPELSGHTHKIRRNIPICLFSQPAPGTVIYTSMSDALLHVLNVFQIVTWTNMLAAATATHVPFLGLLACYHKCQCRDSCKRET